VPRPLKKISVGWNGTKSIKTFDEVISMRNYYCQ